MRGRSRRGARGWCRGPSSRASPADAAHSSPGYRRVHASARAHAPPPDARPRDLLHEPADRQPRHHRSLNVALPAIRGDLDTSVSGLQWTIDAYTLVLASLLMLAGSTADRVGRRRIFQTGWRSSPPAPCSAASRPSLGWLVAFRMLQAVGGSMLNPVAMSIITNTFTEPARTGPRHRRLGRRRRLSAWPPGPIIGGALVDVGRLALHLLDQRPGRPGGAPADHAASSPSPARPAPAASTRSARSWSSSCCASLTYGIIEAPARGLDLAAILGCFALAARRPRRPAPLRAAPHRPPDRPALLPLARRSAAPP